MKRRVLYSYEQLSHLLNDPVGLVDIYAAVALALDSWSAKYISNYAFSAILQKSADLIKKL